MPHSTFRILAATALSLSLIAPAAQAQTTAPTAPVEDAALHRFGEAQPFSFDQLAARARDLSTRPFQPVEPVHSDILSQIDFNAHWRIRFKNEETVKIGDAPVQFFHLGKYFQQPVKIFEVADGQARQILYHRNYFTMPEDSPAMQLGDDTGFAGFRVMRPDLKTDWISFLGASYFRTDGFARQYGLSARGLALNTGTAQTEEFPRFTEFYLETPTDPSQDLIINALLDSPSVAGAYRITLTNRNGLGQVAEVQSRLFFRNGVERLGVAPLTSMFWFSETNRFASSDWRPEVHDTDGLMMVTGNGEEIWRPLNNPDRVVTSTFSDENPRGFGLLQRDRNFENYQDDGIFYDKRPSVWVEPTSDWGKGAVTLVELPTNDEVYDNIGAFWTPAEAPKPGQEIDFNYRLHWAKDAPIPENVARTSATRIGEGGYPGNPRPDNQVKMHVEFTGDVLKGLTRDDVDFNVEISNGVQAIEPGVVAVVGKNDTFRLTFDVASDADTLDIRANLVSPNGEPLTETWLGQIHPRQIQYLRKH
ncbi:glucan biosynthesis protein [Falsirhodobacter sp. 20TX0035]|uniref:glucan biosynthesis protein n=1 Tax=Falsirhodobacter sp. 20TX0035 TaxID=3022019 RepID=UPI00232FC825|nr:glucan biosynthesis protein D [Falsirhodobacter sp. 20TX0035]MDB6453453.1 glucan biosynthesis protein D [Falsirhodobacter sp. 20TX0035]